MESQPQNPEFRINPENFVFHPWLIHSLHASVIFHAFTELSATQNYGYCDTNFPGDS